MAATDSDGDGLTNAFETLYGLSPNSRDSDGDGILDPAEDQDGDGLSNLGEQKFHTNPNLADTDHNGTLDDAEDSNGDSIPDALEQDDWPVPGNLTPSLAGARHDRPLGYSDGCHNSLYDPHIHPCLYGSGMATRTVAMFGDSHGQQWMPALIAAAGPHRWRIVSLTKSACPTVQVKYADPTYPTTITSCATWRSSAEAWLRAHPPDVIIISNTWGYRLIGNHGKVLSGSAFESAWRKGLMQTIGRLPVGPQIVVLADTPHMSRDIPACLQANLTDVAACQASRAHATRPEHDAAEAAAASSTGATFVSLGAAVCSYDPCPIVVDNLLMWRDSNHITATYAKELAPAIVPIVVSALTRAANAPGAAPPASAPPRAVPFAAPPRVVRGVL